MGFLLVNSEQSGPYEVTGADAEQRRFDYWMLLGKADRCELEDTDVRIEALQC